MLSDRVLTLPALASDNDDVDEDRDSIEALSDLIAKLVGERQALRAAPAGAAELERNRLEIARLQQRLSEALIRQFGPAAA